MKTILITGGAGFIGSHLAETLLAKDYRIIAIDNFDNYYPLKYKEHNIEKAQKHKNYKFYLLDLQKINKLKQFFKEHSHIDSLVHLAARAGVRPSIRKPLLYQRINIEGTYNLLHFATQANVNQFIFASSSSVYGNSPVPFTEDSKVNPLSPYGATKIAGEQACLIFHKLYGIPVTVLRFFSVYGPRGRPDMAPYLFTDALFNNKAITQYGDGTSKRDWTYIDDIVDGIIQAIKYPFKYEIINLGNNKPIQLNQLILTIEKYSNKKFHVKRLPARNDEAKITYADISKAKRLLKWKPKVDFKKGMKRFVKWFINERLIYPLY